MMNRLVALVDVLNSDLKRSLEGLGEDSVEYPQFSLKTNGPYFAIMFADLILFSNEEDDGEDDEEGVKKVPFYERLDIEDIDKFIRDQMMYMCSTLGKVDLNAARLQ